MITLLIPTINRSDFLVRLLRYYSDLGFQGRICIGDSSNPMHVEQTKRAIKALQGKLNIVYRGYPHLNEAECSQQLLDFVSTSYAAWVADDDFLVPTALEQCALFLDGHPDYNAAHGVAALFSLQSSGAYGQVAGAGHYRQPVIEGESASQRLLDHLSNYSNVQFSVHRVDSLRAMYGNVSLLADRAFGSELLPCCLSIIQGKVKELDYLYLVRQGHDQRYLLPDPFDWISSPNWLPSYQVFCDCLAEELVRQDGISLDEARAVVKQAFWAYLAKGLTKKWQDRYGQAGAGIRDRLRQTARAIPGARRVWSGLRSAVRGQGEMLLPMLLNPRSPYHDDFMPIYRAVTSSTQSEGI